MHRFKGGGALSDHFDILRPNFSWAQRGNSENFPRYCLEHAVGFLFPSCILVHFVRDQADGQEDGRFLVAPQRYDRLVKEGRDTGQLNLVRVHEHFRVAGMADGMRERAPK